MPVDADREMISSHAHGARDSREKERERERERKGEDTNLNVPMKPSLDLSR